MEFIARLERLFAENMKQFIGRADFGDVKINGEPEIVTIEDLVVYVPAKHGTVPITDFSIWLYETTGDRVMMNSAYTEAAVNEAYVEHDCLLSPEPTWNEIEDALHETLAALDAKMRRQIKSDELGGGERKINSRKVTSQ